MSVSISAGIVRCAKVVLFHLMFWRNLVSRMYMLYVDIFLIVTKFFQNFRHYSLIITDPIVQYSL